MGVVLYPASSEVGGGTAGLEPRPARQHALEGGVVAQLRGHATCERRETHDGGDVRVVGVAVDGRRKLFEHGSDRLHWILNAPLHQWT